MHKRLLTRLRLLAAILVTASGVLRVSSLWFRELSEQAVASLLLGAVYLIIGIGLFGHSRFTLFVAIVIPAATSVLTFNYSTVDGLHPLQLGAVLADLIIIACSTTVLWQVRNEPSV